MSKGQWTTNIINVKRPEYTNTTNVKRSEDTSAKGQKVGVCVWGGGSEIIQVLLRRH